MRDFDHVFAKAPRTFMIPPKKMKDTNDIILDAQAIRLDTMIHLDEKKKKLRKWKYVEYQRRNKVPQTNTQSVQALNVSLNVDIVAFLSKINILVPLVEFLNIPGQLKKVRNFLVKLGQIEQEKENHPTLMQIYKHEIHDLRVRNHYQEDKTLAEEV